MILEILSDREVDPVSFIRKSDTCRSGLDGGELVGGTNTAVVQNTWAGHGSGCEDDISTGLQVDNLTGSSRGLDFDTSGSRARTNNTDHLGVKSQFEV